MTISLESVAIETFPLAGDFRISRGAKTEAVVITVTLAAGGAIGRGEGCPYPRYGEAPEASCTAVETLDWHALATMLPGEARRWLQQALPPGAARNAVDCALWDLESVMTGVPVWRLAGLAAPPAPVQTCYTLSLDTPGAMAAAARSRPGETLLKLKLGDLDTDAARMRAVREARPDARLVADVNEGWSAAQLAPGIAAAAACGIELLEQPLPAGHDQALARIGPAVPICADESAAPGAAIEALAGRYQAANIKLDKTGGLTGAFDAIRRARAAGLRIMLGSMVSTSLSMAPAAHLAALADWVDLDSPLLLARDRPGAMTITNGILSSPTAALWGRSG